jgi:hypothetical protein
MISQNCPRCHSNRIRRGYRPTRFWSKVLFRYNLLCNACNWEFKGFAVPGTVSVKPARKRKNHVKVEQAEEIQNPENSIEEKANIVENLETDVEEKLEEQADDVSEKAVSSNRIRVKKKVRIRQS